MDVDKGGRPTSYKPAYNKQVEKLCKLGATDKEIADFFEVCEDTINEWKKKYPKFSVSIKKGKIEADANVAEALFKRAVGFEYDEVTFEKVDGKEALLATKDGEIKSETAYKKKVVTKLMPGDVAAQNIWLKNRRGRVKLLEGQRWADKQEVGFTDGNGDDVQPVTIFRLPDNGRNNNNPAATGLPDDGAKFTG